MAESLAAACCSAARWSTPRATEVASCCVARASRTATASWADRVNVRSVRARDTVSTTTSTAVMRSGSFCSSDNCRTRGPAAVAVVGSDVVGGRAIAR